MSAVLKDELEEGAALLRCLPAEGQPWRLDFERWPQADALHWRAVLAQSTQGRWAVLADRPVDALLRTRIETQLHCGLRWVACNAADLDELLGAGSAEFRALAQLGEGFGAGAGEALAQELSVLQLAQESSPVVRLLDATLYDALQDGASDIHFECTVRGLCIRYRIDGVMLPVREVDGAAVAEQLVSRLKVMAELDIGERRLPQDGRFKLRVQNLGPQTTAQPSSPPEGGGRLGSGPASTREIDFRLSVMPSVFGEDAVIRVLDRAQIAQQGSLTLDALGFVGELREQIRTLARQPHGMLLVTGPTGSGKTTTLYAAINEVNTGRDKIITIEDPVEYQLAGVVQIPVNDKKGLSFARGLRSVLRHDPDRVMVGEIRDTETAQIAVQAALTGHLVFSTVHANTSFDVIGRFMHMGLDLYNVVSALNGVLAQRLMRLNCAHCRVAQIPTQAQLQAAGLLNAPHLHCARGMGCGHCRGTGYKGRRAIAELLVLDDELRDLIASRAPLGRIKEAARARGMQTLRDVAVASVARGDSTFEELDRVTLDA